jgi:hypothetical protein
MQFNCGLNDLLPGLGQLRGAFLQGVGLWGSRRLATFLPRLWYVKLLKNT